MNRIDRRFQTLRTEGGKALIPYVTAGFPSPQATGPVLRALADAGADLIELGLPFSDPMADGPVIQRACERALAQGMNVAQVLAAVAQFRADDLHTPIVLMGYLNPIVRYDVVRFATDAAAAGVDGLLLVDVPPEEAEVLAPIREQGIHQIFLLAPTSSEQRMVRIVAAARGFVYYVSLTGVTGAGTLSAEAVAAGVNRVRAHTDLPVGVGFGIKTPADALRIADCADAVVVGSALIEAIEHADTPEQAADCARRFLEPFRQALSADRPQAALVGGAPTQQD